MLVERTHEMNPTAELSAAEAAARQRADQSQLRRRHGWPELSRGPTRSSSQPGQCGNWPTLHTEPRRVARDGAFSYAPSMNDSLEVEVLYCNKPECTHMAALRVLTEASLGLAVSPSADQSPRAIDGRSLRPHLRDG